jgi:predicted GTPase
MMRDGGNHGWLVVVPDLVVIATPMDLRRLIRITKPTVRVSYDVEDRRRPTLTDVMQGVIDRAKQS